MGKHYKITDPDELFRVAVESFRKYLLSAGIQTKQDSVTERLQSLANTYMRARKRENQRHTGLRARLHPGRCEVCGLVDGEPKVVQMHHILPMGKGGTHDKDNLLFCCPNCHAKMHRTMWSGTGQDRPKNRKEVFALLGLGEPQTLGPDLSIEALARAVALIDYGV